MHLGNLESTGEKLEKLEKHMASPCTCTTQPLFSCSPNFLHASITQLTHADNLDHYFLNIKSHLHGCHYVKGSVG